MYVYINTANDDLQKYYDQKSLQQWTHNKAKKHPKNL